MESVEEIFELIGYLNQFSKEGIEFKFFDKHEHPLTRESRTSFGYSDQAVKLTSEINLDLEIKTLERFYNRLWKEKEDEFYHREEEFVKNELKFFDKFSEKIKEEYSKKFNPLNSFFKSKNDQLGGKMFLNKSKEKLSEAGKKSKRPPHEATIVKAREILSRHNINNPTSNQICIWMKNDGILNPETGKPYSESWVKNHRDNLKTR